MLRSDNVDALRQNALMVHIRRPVSTLPTDGRPLSKDLAALQEMEKARLPIYTAAADITFDNSKAMSFKKLQTAVDAILK